jgi:ABC-type transport system involved in multi-copper enzyme maturation permease subunit
VTTRQAVPTRVSRLAAVGRWLAWSHLRQYPRELLGGALLLGSGAALLLGGRHLDLLPAVLLWLAWCVAAGLYLRQPATRLVGPVLFYDLLRTTRGGRTFSLRSLYGLLLLVILLLVYLSWFGSGHRGPMAALAGSRLAVHDVPRFAAQFFYAFLGVQYGMVLLLTPASAAAALAEEKERRTLEFVLASELADREILLGKLASRLAHLALLLLVGLPVLSLLQFLGGIDPNLVLAGYAGTFATMLSLGSLSLLNSAYVSRVRGAVFLTYLEAAGYLLLSLMCCAPVATYSGGWNPVNWVGTGNPVVAVIRLETAGRVPGATPGDALLEVLVEYVGFHGLVAGACLAYTARRLRAWNREPPPPEPPPEPVAHLPFLERSILLDRPRPPVGDRPMLWKERYAEPGLGVRRFSRTIGPIPWIIAVPYLFLGLCVLISAGSSFVIRILGTPIACVMLLGVGLRAAGAISGERERHTLDGLLTSPLGNRTILLAKGVASMLSVGRGWWFLGFLWAFGMLLGGLNVLALPLVLLAWVVYAWLAAVIGLWCSLQCRNTLRATVLTLLLVVVAGVGPLVLWSWLDAVASFGGLRRELIGNFEAYRLMPPVTLFLLAFQETDFTPRGLLPLETLHEVLLGVVAYAVLAAVLWNRLVARFGPVTGRMP